MIDRAVIVGAQRTRGTAVRSRRRQVRLALGLALGLALAACSGSGDTASDETVPASEDTTVDGSAGEIEALPSGEPEPPSEGEARVVLGSDLDVALTVQTCVRDLGAQPDGQVPAAQVAITATGARADGTPLLLDVRRFVSAGAAPTITDTVTLLEGTEDAPERVLVAQRFEVGGLVTDLRDPDADDPLLRAGALVEARAVFAPPGAAAGDDGLVDGIVLIACGG